MSLLRGQLVNVFYDFITDIFVEKMREAFAPLHCKSFTHFFNKKYWHISDIKIWYFNETFTNDGISFEQPGLGIDSFHPKSNDAKAHTTLNTVCLSFRSL